MLLRVFAYLMSLRCMLKFKPLACGSDDVTQYSTMWYVLATLGRCSLQLLLVFYATQWSVKKKL